MDGAQCSRCKAPAGVYVVRLRLKPLDDTQMVVLGERDPGPDWWAVVTRFWNVSDAPKPSSWIAPARVALVGGRCGYCRAEEKRNETPSLFDAEPEA